MYFLNRLGLYGEIMPQVYFGKDLLLPLIFSMRAIMLKSIVESQRNITDDQKPYLINKYK
jgi:hypothetical protein